MDVFKTSQHSPPIPVSPKMNAKNFTYVVGCILILMSSSLAQKPFETTKICVGGNSKSIPPHEIEFIANIRFQTAFDLTYARNPPIIPVIVRSGKWYVLTERELALAGDKIKLKQDDWIFALEGGVTCEDLEKRKISLVTHLDALKELESERIDRELATTWANLKDSIDESTGVYM